MSLVNDMLKDLERRRVQHPPKVGDVLSGIHTIDRTAWRKQRWIYYGSSIVITLLMLALCVWAGARWGHFLILDTTTDEALVMEVVQEDIPTIEETMQPVVSKPVAEVVTPKVEPVKAASTVVPQHVVKKTAVALSAKQQAQQGYQRALLLLEQGDQQGGGEQLAALVQRFPKHQASRYALAELVSKQGDRQRARTLLQQGLRLSPKYPPFTEMLAHIYVAEDNYPLALSTLQSSQPTMAENLEYYAFLAALHEHVGHYAKSASLYSVLLQHQPQNAIWWLGLAIALEGSGQAKQARHAYRKAELSQDLQPQLQNYIHKRLAILEG